MCQECPKGYSCDGSSKRTRCLPGFYADGGESQCHECGDDSKHSQHEADQCSTCKVGSYTSGGTAKTRTTCVSCPSGYSCDGTSQQTLCPSGHYSPGGDETCKECGDEHMYSVAGAASCSFG